MKSIIGPSWDIHFLTCISATMSWRHSLFILRWKSSLFTCLTFSEFQISSYSRYYLLLNFNAFEYIKLVWVSESAMVLRAEMNKVNSSITCNLFGNITNINIQNNNNNINIKILLFKNAQQKNI